MKNKDIKELPNLLDKYGRKIIITNYIKELTNFLDEYGVDYKIVENKGSPYDNGFKFCPYCGKQLKIKKPFFDEPAI